MMGSMLKRASSLSRGLVFSLCLLPGEGYSHLCSLVWDFNENDMFPQTFFCMVLLLVEGRSRHLIVIFFR